nr:HAD family hydrolase [Nocardioides perillae]
MGHVSTSTSRPTGTRLPEPRLPEGPVDLGLVVVDMDGTLLDGEGRVPDGLWPLLERLRARDVVFAPASGRQLATLQATFDRLGDDLVVIAENGAFVVRGDEEVSSTVLDHAVVHEVVRAMREHAAGGHDVGVVVCGKRSAYVESADPHFREQAGRYYARLEQVADLVAVDDEVLKVAVFDPTAVAEHTAPALERFRTTHQVVVSGHHWVDVMDAATSKGVALRRLQETLGVGPERTAAFGDYLNDLEMVGEAEHSVAVANAHPEVLAAARWVAPSNLERGVLVALETMLGEVSRRA